MKNYLHFFTANPGLHLFWLPAMLLAWGIYALSPLHVARLWFGILWVLALVFGFLTLLALIGARTSLLAKASDVAWLNKHLRWLQPLSALLGALVLALAVDLLVNWLRGPSDEREVTLRRVYCLVSSPPPFPPSSVPESKGQWCFDTGGLTVSNIDIPVSQIPRPVPLGETARARWRSY
ncbi:MAG: hypothetical protein IKU14_01960, partial [Rhodocyclaceae bacterium]|nr:hypothetical protein [Rhodocyclaceae bacterium]